MSSAYDMICIIDLIGMKLYSLYRHVFRDNNIWISTTHVVTRRFNTKGLKKSKTTSFQK